jgi:hypothetical protein
MVVFAGGYLVFLWCFCGVWEQWYLISLSTDSSVAIMAARDPACISLQAFRTLLEVLLTPLVCQSVSMSAIMGLLTARCTVLTLSSPGGVKSDRTLSKEEWK